MEYQIVLGAKAPRHWQKGYAVLTGTGNYIVHWQDDTKEIFPPVPALHFLNEKLSQEEYAAQFQPPNVKPGDVITREHEICLRVDINVDKGHTCEYDGKPKINARFCWDHRITSDMYMQGLFEIGEDQFDNWVHADGTECDHGKAGNEALFQSITIPDVLEKVYPTLDESRFRWGIVKTNDLIRALVPWAELPDEIKATFYCENEDAVPTSVQSFGPAEIDPEKHHGYGEIHFSSYRPVGITAHIPGNVIKFSSEPEKRWDHLVVCPECKSQYCVYKQEAYGDSQNCPDCKFNSWYSIGD